MAIEDSKGILYAFSIIEFAIIQLFGKTDRKLITEQNLSSAIFCCEVAAKVLKEADENATQSNDTLNILIELDIAMSTGTSLRKESNYGLVHKAREILRNIFDSLIGRFNEWALRNPDYEIGDDLTGEQIALITRLLEED